jgi:hypothetical protein
LTSCQLANVHVLGERLPGQWRAERATDSFQELQGCYIAPAEATNIACDDAPEHFHGLRADFTGGEVIFDRRRESTNVLVGAPCAFEIVPREVQPFHEAQAFGTKHLSGGERLRWQGDSHGVNTEISEGYRDLKVVSALSLSARQLLAPHLPRRRAGAKNEASSLGTIVHDILHTQLPILDRGHLVDEEVPRSFGIRVQLPRPMHHLCDVSMGRAQIEGVIQYATLALVEEPPDQAFGSRRFSDLPWTTQGVDSLKPNLDRVEHGWVPVEGAALKGANLGVALDRGRVTPPEDSCLRTAYLQATLDQRLIPVRKRLQSKPCHNPSWSVEEGNTALLPKAKERAITIGLERVRCCPCRVIIREVIIVLLSRSAGGRPMRYVSSRRSS